MHVRAKGGGALLSGSFEVITPRRNTTMTATTRDFATIESTPALFASFELEESSWKLGFTTRMGKRPRGCTIGARDRGAVRREIERAKERLGLPGNARSRAATRLDAKASGCTGGSCRRGSTAA
jgi:hypothetical protein